MRDLFYRRILLRILINMEEHISMYYDKEGDFMKIMFGYPNHDYGDHISKDIVLFRNQKNR